MFYEYRPPPSSTLTAPLSPYPAFFLSLMHREFQPTVYLLASDYNGTLYLGVTSDLLQRIAQHRDGTFQGFSNRYGVRMLVWSEQHSTMEKAILREKRIKKWRSEEHQSELQSIMRNKYASF